MTQTPSPLTPAFTTTQLGLITLGVVTLGLAFARVLVQVGDTEVGTLVSKRCGYNSVTETTHYRLYTTLGDYEVSKETFATVEKGQKVTRYFLTSHKLEATN